MRRRAARAVGKAAGVFARASPASAAPSARASRRAARPAMRCGSSVAKASTKRVDAALRPPRAVDGISSQSRISAFCRRIACGPPARIGAAKRSTAAIEIAGRHDAVDKPPGERRRRRRSSRRSAARLRARPAPISRGSSAASTTDGMPIRTSGMPKMRAVAGDAEIAGGGELQPGAERVAVDPGDRPAPADGGTNRSRRWTRVMKSRALSRSSAGELVDVGAADKGAPAGAGQDREPQMPGRPRAPVIASRNLDHQRAVEALSLPLVVDRDTGDNAAFRPRLAHEPRHPSRLRLELAAPLVHTRREQSGRRA